MFSLDEFEALTPAPLFIRGDINWDETIDVSDGIAILHNLFRSRRPFACADAADVNDDGAVDLTDPIAVFRFGLLGTFTPPDPRATIGPDPTDDTIGCDVE